MVRRGVGVLVGLLSAVIAAIPSPGLAAQVDLTMFAPARDAKGAIQAARRAGAAEMAGQDLRLANLYIEDASAALQPASGPPDMEKATRLFRLAEAQARLAEVRAIEEARKQEAAGAAFQFLQAIEGAPPGMAASGPSVSEAAIAHSRLQRDAGRARSTRRAAEQALEKVWREGD